MLQFSIKTIVILWLVYLSMDIIWEIFVKKNKISSKKIFSIVLNTLIGAIIVAVI